MKLDNITLNFLDKYIMFYDWCEEDDIKREKNILLYKISSNEINDLLMHYVKILNQKLFSQKAIFTDGYFFIAIEFSENGNIIKKSSITLKDEEKLYKYISRLPNIKLKYEVVNDDIPLLEIRKKTHMKKYIHNELNKLIVSNIDKFNYIYYEWFKKEDDCIDRMKTNIKTELNKPYNKDIQRIYELIKN